MILHRRRSILFGAAVVVLVGGAAVSAAHSAVSLTVREASVAQLLLPSDKVEVKYVIDTAGVVKPTGTVFVRRDGQSAFTALPLQLGWDIANGRHPSLHLILPTRFLAGQRLFYYAQLQDPASGASITVPAEGARAPQTAWIMHRPVVVRMGAYRFGHPTAAEAVVARASAKNIGWDLRFQTARARSWSAVDGAIWLEDTWKHRILVWRAGKPNAPVRSLPLPTQGRHHVSFEDMAFGPKGTLYVIRLQRGIPGFQLFRINAKTGKVLWKSSSYPAASWDGLPRSGVPLRIGVDGTLYASLDRLDFETTGTPDHGWMPLATPAGKPIPPGQQFERILWGYQRAASGRRFINEYSVPPGWRYLPREWRFAVVNRHGRVLHAWRVVSRTSISARDAQLLNGRIVADFLKSEPGTLEHLFVRLDGKGLDAKASIPYRVSGTQQSTDVRVGPDGKIYALATSPRDGITIHRYTLGR